MIKSYRGQSEYNTHSRQNIKTFFQYVVKLPVIFGAVVKSDDRRAADRVADKYRDEDKLHIHKNSVCRNAVLARDAKKLEVIEHTDDGRRNVGHKLRGAVSARSENGF